MPLIPVKTHLATLYAGGFLSHGQSLTFTVNLIRGWELQIPLGVQYGSAVSMPVAWSIYPSSDGGATFDTDPTYGFGITAVASAQRRLAVRVPTGIYAIQVQASTPSLTVFVLTQELITAIIATP